MKIILFVLGLLFAADGLYLGATTTMGVGEAVMTAIGIMLILWSTFYDAFKEKTFLKVVKGLFVAFMAVIVAYSCLICVVGKSDNATYDEAYIVVLGAGLNGDEPSEMLEKRLEKSVEYMYRNSDAIAIVTGGQGRNEDISEAEAMRNYLLMRGMSEERVYMEENAKSTYENFEYARLLTEEGRVVFVTNEFHVLRSSLMAELNGVNATHLSASTPITLLPVSCIREFFAQIASVRHYF